MDKKNQQSKSQFGTLTAKQDANQDYTSSSKSGASGGAMSGGAMSGGSASGAGTLTAQFDANNDYGGGGKSGSQSQSGQQKVKTSDKNIK